MNIEVLKEGPSIIYAFMPDALTHLKMIHEANEIEGAEIEDV